MGGSGGGSSGKSDYPDYMKGRHEQWLLALGAHLPDGGSPDTSPFYGVTAYNPDTLLAPIDTELAKYITYVDSVGLNATAIDNLWESLTDTIATKLDAKLITGATFITTAAGNISAAVISGIAPVRTAFRAGMRGINAVNTSVFTLGDALINSRATNDINKTAGEVLIRSVADRNRGVTDGGFTFLESTMKFTEIRKLLSIAVSDMAKIKIIAKKEQADRQVEYDVEEAKWTYYQWEAAGNLLGSIGGSHGGGAVASKPNPTASTLGGAMAGASVGAMIGSAGPQATIGGTLWGAVIGAVVGGVGGYFSSQ